MPADIKGVREKPPQERKSKMEKNTTATASISYLTTRESGSTKWSSTELMTASSPAEILIGFFAELGKSVTIVAESTCWSSFKVEAIDSNGEVVGYLNNIFFEHKNGRAWFFGLETPEEEEARLDAEMERFNAMAEAQRTPLMADGTPREGYYPESVEEAPEGLVSPEEAEYLAQVDLNTDPDEYEKEDYDEGDDYETILLNVDSWIFGGIAEYIETIQAYSGHKLDEEKMTRIDWQSIENIVFSTVNDYLPGGITIHPLGWMMINRHYGYNFEMAEEFDSLAISAIWKARNVSDLMGFLVQLIGIKTEEEAA